MWGRPFIWLKLVWSNLIILELGVVISTDLTDWLPITWVVTNCCRPMPKDKRKNMAPMPITTPNMVRKARSFLCTRFFQAIYSSTLGGTLLGFLNTFLN